MDIFQYEQTHNMMQVWTGMQTDKVIPVYPHPPPPTPILLGGGITRVPEYFAHVVADSSHSI